MLVEKVKEVFEKGLFGVFSTIGDKMGIASSRIRLFFVYITFLGIGSPIVVYLAMAFIMNIGHYIKNRRRNPIWDF
jgi:phage shock protein PspC (stress-responsive transcriptional regulator)